MKPIIFSPTGNLPHSDGSPILECAQCNLTVIPVPSMEGRSGTRVPSGDAGPGHKTAVQNTKQALCCQNMRRDRLRAEGGLRGCTILNKCGNNVVKNSDNYKRLYKDLHSTYLRDNWNIVDILRPSIFIHINHN